MKKVLLGLVLGLFVMFAFSSCEKEEEEEAQQQLSEFIVGGNWVYTELDYSNPTHVGVLIFTGQFLTNGVYYLHLTDGNESMNLAGTYTIDDVENELTLTNPFYVEGENDEFDSFAVEWQEGIDEMYWSDTENGSDDVMKWERNYEE